jgi:uncharacterized protein (TIGR02594 family)
MRYEFRLALVAGCVGLIALSAPALSRPAAKHKQTRAVPVAQRPLPAPEPVSLSARIKPFGSPDLVAEARKYMGTNPTDRQRLWCATFMNMVLAKVGYAGTNSDAAKSFAYYGRRISEPQIGAIAVLTRGKRGGHVGVVSGVDKNGNPIIISGNHNKRVGEATYARSRVIAYVMPTDRRAAPTQAAARSTPSSEFGFESPIAELLAAIEAEQAKDAVPRAPAPQPVQQQQPAPQQAQRPVPPPAPPVPSRVVQQTAEPVPQAASPQAAPRAPISNPFAELVSKIERGPTMQQPSRARGHVAAAENGRGIR